MKRLKEKSVVYTWIISYIFLLLVPIAFHYFIYFRTQAVMQEEIIEANQALMGQVQNELDSILTNTMTVYMDISNNANIRELEQTDGTSQYLIYQLIRDIELYQYSMPKDQDVFVYFRSQDLIVSRRGDYSAAEYYEEYYAGSDLTFQQWKQYLGGNEGWWQAVRSGDGQQMEVLYFNRLAGSAGVRENVTFVSSISPSLFTEQMEKMRYAQQGYLMVLTDENRQIYANRALDQGITQEALHNSLQGRQGSTKISEGAEHDYIMTYAKSNVLNWNYIYVLPNSVLMGKVNQIRWIVTGVTAISILFGILMILYLIKKQYMPVKKLMDLVRKADGESGAQGSNEFDYLEDAIKTEIKGKDRIENELERQKRMVRISYLSKLLRGKVQDKHAIREMLEMLEIPCDNSQYAVLLFDVKDYTKLFENDQSLTNEKRVELANFILTNIVEELVDESYNGVMFECEDCMVCLVTADDQDGDHLDDRLEDIANHAMDLVKQNFRLECNVGISQVYHTYLDIPQAYQDTVETLEYSFASGEHGVQRYDRFLEGAVGTIKFSAEDRQRLIASLKTFRRDDIICTAEEIMNQNEPFLQEDPQALKSMLFEFVSALIRASDEIDADGILSAQVIDVEHIRSLLACTSAPELRDCIGQIAKLVEAKDNTRVSGDDILTKVQEYIVANYNDDNLNVAQIGAEFHMTPHYLSKMFKQKYGVGMLEYINKIRVERSKQILQTTGKTLDSVSAEVGFTNSVTFIRVFKKYTGMTPGKYRETL